MESEVGKITHYYSKLGVGIVNLSESLTVGDQVHFKGPTTDFSQTVSSLQVEYKEVGEAKKGEMVGMKTDQKVREGDQVLKVS